MYELFYNEEKIYLYNIKSRTKLNSGRATFPLVLSSAAKQSLNHSPSYPSPFYSRFLLLCCVCHMTNSLSSIETNSTQRNVLTSHVLRCLTFDQHAFKDSPSMSSDRIQVTSRPGTHGMPKDQPALKRDNLI